MVVRQAAYELPLTVDQVRTQVHAGKTFALIASPGHMTAQQWHVFAIHAQLLANDYWLGPGCITRQDETSNMQRDHGDAVHMDSAFTGAFR